MTVKTIYKIKYSYNTGLPKDQYQRITRETNWVFSKTKTIDTLQKHFHSPKRDLKIEEIKEEILQYDIVLI